MSPGSHLLASWLIANSLPLQQRERRLVTLAGMAPDLDGAGYLVDRVAALFSLQTEYYFQYHHLLGHGLLAAGILALAASLLANERRLRVFGLSFVAVHVHFLADVVGSRGPDGDQWPIYYLYPFCEHLRVAWAGQWELSAWPNTLITGVMFLVAARRSFKQRYSFIEVISPWLDRRLFAILAKYGWIPPSETQERG